MLLQVEGAARHSHGAAGDNAVDTGTSSSLEAQLAGASGRGSDQHNVIVRGDRMCLVGRTRSRLDQRVGVRKDIDVVCLPNLVVSGVHLCLSYEEEDECFTATDLGSTHGTMLVVIF